MKRFLALLLACGLLSGCSGANTQELAENTVQSDTAFVVNLDTTAGALTSDDLADYENGEILVEYTDGSFEVLTCPDEADLSATLERLSSDETVCLIQPNYTYSGTDLPTDDALAAQQWALANDGSFQMEEQENRFPVYDDPFKTPSAPGQWMMPGDFGQPGGGYNSGMRGFSFQQMSTAQQSSAVEGIDINVETAWESYGGGSREVVIALIDTGIDYTHEDLTNSIWVNEDEIAGNGIDDDGNGYIDDVYGWNFYSNNNKVYSGSEDDHGTHGAGTITAEADNGVGIAGIVQSENVKIMVLKALGGSNGSGSTASIVRAIQYAEANGASICNLSLGSSTNDRALYQAIANSSMLFVAAAGNDGSNLDRVACYPASYQLENIISVANLNYDGTLHASSNYGTSSVDLAAPGSYILSTTINGGYSYMTGTSMAAPMVTAAAAMVYSHYEDITLSDVKELLLSSTKALASLENTTVTGGMLDLGAALSYDLTTLVSYDWEVPSDAGSGVAPEISAEAVLQNGQQYLKVLITDADGDLSVTAYAAGVLSAQHFQGGTVGQKFTAGEGGSVFFSVKSSGIFTFYASDSAGNETVKTISLTGSTQWNTPSNQTNPPGRDWSGGRSAVGQPFGNTGFGMTKQK